jgi:purine-binding chemotaxis protein CheW
MGNSFTSSSRALVVAVADLLVAWPVEVVDEVLRMVAIDELPGAPDVIVGVVDLRGHVVPVLDLRRRLGRPVRPQTLDDRLVSVVAGDVTMLVKVDVVHGLQSLDQQTIQPLTGDLAASPHLSGVVHALDGLLFVQDPGTFLTCRETVELATALLPASAGR